MAASLILKGEIYAAAWYIYIGIGIVRGSGYYIIIPRARTTLTRNFRGGGGGGGG